MKQHQRVHYKTIRKRWCSKNVKLDVLKWIAIFSTQELNWAAKNSCAAICDHHPINSNPDYFIQNDSWSYCYFVNKRVKQGDVICQLAVAFLNIKGDRRPELSANYALALKLPFIKTVFDFRVVTWSISGFGQPRNWHHLSVFKSVRLFFVLFYKMAYK